MSLDYKTLVAHLDRTGRMKLLPQILRELRVQEEREKALAPFVEVAHEKESAAALHTAAGLGIEAAHAHVNHGLIKGFRARANGKLVDHSAKRALIDLYQQITA